MININIKGTEIELTPAIKDYIQKKVGSLDKFIAEHEKPDTKTQVWVEVGVSTKHHQTGNIFRAEIQIDIPHFKGGKGIRAESEREDLYVAIDEARDEIQEELCRINDKKISLVRRGARKFKQMFFGK